MSDRVWKYVLPEPHRNGRAFVDMPADVEPLSVGIQGDEIVVWALVDPDYEPPSGYMPSGPRRFIVANTGMDIPGFPEGAKFLGTVTSATGIVWHIWDGDARTTA